MHCIGCGKKLTLQSLVDWAEGVCDVCSIHFTLLADPDDGSGTVNYIPLGGDFAEDVDAKDVEDVGASADA